MSLFNFTPQQYYSRQNINQNTGVFYNPSETTPFGYGGGPFNNVASFVGYNPRNNTIPGTVGYRLPAQSYYNYGANYPAQFGTQTLKTGLVNTAINSALQGFVYGLTGGPSTDPTGGRLSGTGVTQGATQRSLLEAVNGESNTAWQDDSEDRVIIYDQTGQFIGRSEIFAPLEDLGGVLFPYTPTIQASHRASYEMMSLVHTNYVTPMYQHSQIENITIQGTFTANYPAEAEYIIAMMHFFRSATKSFYGQDQLAGTPPPVLFLDAYGPWTFDHIPVVITNFDYTMPADVDYISCTVRTQKQKVPTTLQINLTMTPTYSRNKISNQFGLSDFAQGKLTTGAMSNRKREGGWL